VTRRSWRTRARLAAVAAALSTALVVSACTSADSDQAVTVTNDVTVGGSTPPGTGTAGTTSKQDSPTKGSTSGKPAPGKPAGTTPKSVGPGGTPSDGFVPTKLKAGQKAPQFIVVSFDGVGWHEKWQYWFDIMSKVPFHFTGFLSGTYMLSQDSKMKYTGPGHKAGKSSINWNLPSDLPIEIGDLNKSIAMGNEVGTHFNGHFCSDNPPGGMDWDTGNWNDELDQFFSLMKNVNVNNNLPATTKLNIDPSEIKGERTPCLEGHKADLFPALKAHGMTYDSSFTRRGISWPTKSQTDDIWQFGMAEFPMHGTSHYQITMDYNFYYSQRNASSNGVSAAQSAGDSKQVQATYQDMYNATYHGNRAPLVLGNHFNAWNNNAYSDAIGNFVLANCGKPDTYCVPFRDVIAWMNLQDPAVLAKLQAQDPELKAG
jgi:hypothetical protein